MVDFFCGGSLAEIIPLNFHVGPMSHGFLPFDPQESTVERLHDKHHDTLKPFMPLLETCCGRTKS